MSKAIVQTLMPDARAEKQGDQWQIVANGEPISARRYTASEAWHNASVRLREKDYDKWFEAARAGGSK